MLTDYGSLLCDLPVAHYSLLVLILLQDARVLVRVSGTMIVLFLVLFFCLCW